MPNYVQMTKKQFDDLTLKQEQMVGLKKQAPKKRRSKPTGERPPSRDKADILALWLSQNGVQVISEAEYHMQLVNSSYQQATAVREFHFARPYRQFRADFAWPQLRLLCEVDGGNRIIEYDRNGNPVVAGRHTQDSDYEKTNFVCLMFYRRLAFSTTQLENDPLGCVDVIKAAIGGRLL